MSSHTHSHGDRESLPALTARLRDGSVKVTGPRKAILEAMRQHPHPMTNKEIHAALPEGEACDLATIYRSMNRLEKLGMVKRYDFGDNTARFELLGKDDDGHHHHLICRQCSEVIEIDECFPTELEERIARTNGFSNVTHKLEFFGTCPDCQTDD